MLGAVALGGIHQRKALGRDLRMLWAPMGRGLAAGSGFSSAASMTRAPARDAVKSSRLARMGGGRTGRVAPAAR
jgi:hypothetical protein